MLLYYSSLNSWSLFCLFFFLYHDVCVCTCVLLISWNILCWFKQTPKTLQSVFVSSWSSSNESNKIHKIKKRSQLVWNSTWHSPFSLFLQKSYCPVHPWWCWSVPFGHRPVQQRCGQGEGRKSRGHFCSRRGSPCISMAARVGGWRGARCDKCKRRGAFGGGGWVGQSVGDAMLMPTGPRWGANSPGTPHGPEIQRNTQSAVQDECSTCRPRVCS